VGVRKESSNGREGGKIYWELVSPPTKPALLGPKGVKMKPGNLEGGGDEQKKKSQESCEAKKKRKASVFCVEIDSMHGGRLSIGEGKKR